MVGEISEEEFEKALTEAKADLSVAEEDYALVPTLSESDLARLASSQKDATGKLCVLAARIEHFLNHTFPRESQTGELSDGTRKLLGHHIALLNSIHKNLYGDKKLVAHADLSPAHIAALMRDHSSKVANVTPVVPKDEVKNGS